MFESVIVQSQARTYLRGHWQQAIFAMLLVSLPELAATILFQLTAGQQLIAIQQQVLRSGMDFLLTDADAMQRILRFGGMNLGMQLVAWLITAPLTVGLFHLLLERLHGGDIRVTQVFERLNIAPKAIGLQMLICLKTLLWMLPGIVLIAGGSALLPNLNISLYSALQLAQGLTVVGLVASAILGGLALIRYTLAMADLANQPDRRVMDCIRRSKQIMKGRTRAYLLLLLSYAGWWVLVLLAQTSLIVLFGNVLGLMLYLIVRIAFLVYFNMGKTVFYALHLPTGSQKEISELIRQDDASIE